MDSKLNFFNGKRILITGGGGYLGSKLAQRLLGSKAIIYLIDLKFNNISKRISLNNENVKLIKANLVLKDEISEVCLKIKPQYIFHFAAMLDRERDFSKFENLYDANVKATFNLIESLREIDYSGFFFASTSEVYGVDGALLFCEEQIPAPPSPYSLTKFMAENLIRTYSRINKKPFIIFRLFNFFGPEMGSNTFIGQILNHLNKEETFKMTKGEQKRDLMFIDNVLDQILHISLLGHTEFDTYNVCSNKTYRIIDIALMLQKLTNNKFKFETSLPYRANEIWEMRGSDRRILSSGYIHKEESLENQLMSCIMATNGIEN